MKKVTYFDVEFANPKNKSICQLGILCEEYPSGEPYFPERDFYVNPDDGFDYNCVKIHGITADMVKSAPTFPTVWKEIEKYFTNAVVVGHNVAASDLDALVKNLSRYNLDVPELYYICTLELAKEYVPKYAVKNYSMSSLCEFFDIDIDNAHDAFSDACANADLLKALVDTYNIDIDRHIKKYIHNDVNQFSKFLSSPAIRKEITDFYGVIRGFSIDNIISGEEKDYLVKWRDNFGAYRMYPEIAKIIRELNKVLSDGIVTIEEITDLQHAVKKYLEVVSTSPITLATQILNGIMKGITLDGVLTEAECKNFRQWLYDNIYLSGHYPFDKIIDVIDKALDDSIITAEEIEFIQSTVDSILNPVESLKSQIYTIDNKSFCLSGNFSYGPKSDVENYIMEHGGVIDSCVKKTTDYLIVGSLDCDAYAHGTYGTKIKKAIEYNDKGANIQIIKEDDFFAC